jgi:hypothetical protein
VPFLRFVSSPQSSIIFHTSYNVTATLREHSSDKFLSLSSYFFQELAYLGYVPRVCALSAGTLLVPRARPGCQNCCARGQPDFDTLISPNKGAQTCSLGYEARCA